jgi:hypothetical protein
MPNISLTLPETGQSITRPVIFDIISQVQTITKLSDKTTILYPGDSMKNQTPGTSIDSKTDRFAMFNTDRYSFIEVEEDYDHETLGSTAITRPEQVPVFLDEKLKVQITPIYAASNVVINFRYRCTSKSEAIKWRDDVRIRVSQMRDVNLHSLTYHYLLPAEIIALLKTIYERREGYLGYGDTFEEYIANMSTSRLTLVGDLVANDARLAISETQTRVIGLFGFDGIPDKLEKDDPNGSWTINFSYKFSYEKPIGCHLKYPIIVHNQLLPKSYTYYTNKSYDLSKVSKYNSISMQALNGFESDTLMDTRVNQNALIHIPEFDDYQILSTPKGTGTIFIALAEVNITDSMSLFSLDELGDIVIDSDIMDFIKGSEYPYLCDVYQSIIHVHLYRNEYLTASGDIKCDINGNLSAKIPLDLRNQYRVRFSLVVDLTLLSRDALDRLRRWPKALIKIIQAMNELLKNRPDFNDLGSKNYISELEFSPIYAMLTGYTYDNGRGRGPNNYYGSGLPVNNWNGRSVNGPLFYGIDPLLIENYRRNRVAFNTVEVTGIISLSNRGQ